MATDLMQRASATAAAMLHKGTDYRTVENFVLTYSAYAPLFAGLEGDALAALLRDIMREARQHL